MANGPTIRRKSYPPLPEELEWRARVWAASPDRVRVEYQRDADFVPVGTRVSSINGDRDSVVEDNPIQHLLDPSGLIGVLDFHSVRKIQIGARPAYLVSATPRLVDRRQQGALHRLALGADHHVLSIDAQRGVVMRAEAQLNGYTFALTELSQIAYDQQLPEDVFSRSWLSQSRIPITETVSLEEAARRAPFTLMVPSRAPTGAVLLVRLRRSVGVTPFSVTLFYHPWSAGHSVRMTQSVVGGTSGADLDWQKVQREGKTLWVSEPEAVMDVLQRHVKTVSDGTIVKITSKLDTTMLIAIALSLVPATTWPPTI